MPSRKYEVLINGNIAATHMDLDIAILLISSLFEHYYNDYKMEISIKQLTPNDAAAADIDFCMKDLREDEI